MSGDLNHSAADVLRYLLIAEGRGTLPTDSGSWPVFMGHEPDDPDNTITVYNTTGRLHGRHHDTGITQQHYGIQARIRGADETTGFDKAQDVLNEFDEITRVTVTIGSDTYLVQAVHATTGVIPLGVESAASRRMLFTIDALADLRMTS